MSRHIHKQCPTLIANDLSALYNAVPIHLRKASLCLTLAAGSTTIYMVSGRLIWSTRSRHSSGMMLIKAHANGQAFKAETGNASLGKAVAQAA